MQFFWMLGVIIFLLLVAGLILWYRTKKYIDRAHATIGVVIKVKKIPYEGWVTFSPVVRFETHDGRALSFTDPIAKYPTEFEVGEHAQVFYDPQDPHNARAVKRISDLFLSAKLFTVGGVALWVLGIMVGMVIQLIHTLPGLF